MAIQTINVANASELSNALANATGGETILLASADFGALNLKGSQYASNVTIKSADSSSMASFSQAYLDQSSNITFDAIKFDYIYSAGDRTFASKFRVENSSNITFTDSIFDGDTATGAGNGKGLVVRGSTNVDVIDSEFHSWWKAMNFSTTDDINILGNNIHSIRSDGINLGRVQNVMLEQNYIHDFVGLAGAKDHRDMIQIQRSSGDGSSNITIRDNIMDMGTGDYTQGIWAGTDKFNRADPTNWHQNIVIEGNVMYNAHTNGIAIHATDGLVIKENTLLAVPRAVTGGITIPKIIVSTDSVNVTVEQNIASGLYGDTGRADWSVQNNAFVQNTDPNAAGFYDNQFTYHATAQADGYNQFGIKSGSLADQVNAGSSISSQPAFSYDAWVNLSTTGSSQPGTSGNGGTGAATGGSVTPVPDAPATGGVDAGGGDTASPAAPTTDQSQTNNPVPVDTPEAEGDPQTGMTFDDFVLDIANASNTGQAQLKGDASVVDGANGPAIQFDGYRDKVDIGRLTQFENSEQIAFNVEFARDEADGSSQRLVWNHRKVGLTLTEDGLIAHVRNNDDPFHKGFKVGNLGLNDTDTHQISLMVDQASDRLQVVVDGNLVLDETGTDFDFVGGDGQEWGWDIGTHAGRYVDGQVSAFAIDDDVVFIDQPIVNDDLFA